MVEGYKSEVRRSVSGHHGCALPNHSASGRAPWVCKASLRGLGASRRALWVCKASLRGLPHHGTSGRALWVCKTSLRGLPHHGASGGCLTACSAARAVHTIRACVPSGSRPVGPVTSEGPQPVRALLLSPLREGAPQLGGSGHSEWKQTLPFLSSFLLQVPSQRTLTTEPPSRCPS